MEHKRKAEMGIGTLIVFIAMILVAAIAAGVLIQTASSLQNKALLTGERSKGQVSTALTTMLLYGEDARDGSVEVFCQKLKLAPGSDAIRFSDALIEFSTKNLSSDKRYGNRTINVEINNTNATKNESSEHALNIDFDNDGTFDNATLNASCEALIIQISNGSNGVENVTITGLNLSEQGDGAQSDLNDSDYNISIFDAEINDSSVGQWGALSIIAFKQGTNCTLNLSDTANVYFIGVGENSTSGYDVDYLIRGDNYQEGYLQRGDVVKLCYSGPRAVNEDESVSVTIVPKIGNPSVIETALPDVMTEMRVSVYP